MSSHVIMLILTIVTDGNKPDITRRLTMPDLQTCVEQAADYLKSKPPAGAQGLGAACFVPKEVELPS